MIISLLGIKTASIFFHGKKKSVGLGMKIITQQKRPKPLRQYIKVHEYIMEVHKISKDGKAELPKHKWNSRVT